MASQNKTQAVKVKQNDEKPEPVEVIAQSIIDVSAAFKKINSSRLSKRAIVLLIQDAAPSRLSLNDIQVVLNTAAQLEETYIKKPAK